MIKKYSFRSLLSAIDAREKAKANHRKVSPIKEDGDSFVLEVEE